jgi:hypothetical protein
MHPAQYWRRRKSAEYLKDIHGHGSERTLAKLATIGGGPEIIYSGRIPLYTQESLDKWALSKLSAPVRSTSERPAQSRAPDCAEVVEVEPEAVSERDHQNDATKKRGRPAGAKPISATLDRIEAAEAGREAR